MQTTAQDEDLMSLYQEIILDHGKSPRNTGMVENASCKSEGRNPLCGDRVTVTAALDGETISDICIDGKGCAISIASASMMTEALKGLSKSQAAELHNAVHQLCTEDVTLDDVSSQLEENLVPRLDKLVALSGVRRFPVRVKCATLPWHAMMACLQGEDSATTET